MMDTSISRQHLFGYKEVYVQFMSGRAVMTLLRWYTT